ncbi:MAG: endonuclease III [Magnetococcales bacterium]|nr:endonuclease III [Magnetococcales bacterium]NGZ27248.1 endonuclease III [Magnetococcales bacterium]
MQTANIMALFSRLREGNPHPKSELTHHTPFELLVAVVLSAQSTDVGVNKVTPALFAAAPDAHAMLKLGEEGIRQFIRTLGLFNNKARNLALLCQQLVEHHDGQVPSDRESLEALPGVGRKTANVVLNVAFGQPTLAVDTHVFRVANRTGLVVAKTPEATELQLLKVIPAEFLTHAHHWLILHGRYVCKARQPLCGQCPIETWCEFDEKNRG